MTEPTNGHITVFSHLWGNASYARLMFIQTVKELVMADEGEGEGGGGGVGRGVNLVG